MNARNVFLRSWQVILISVFTVAMMSAQTLYYTIGSGDWETPGVWARSVDGVVENPSPIAPPTTIEYFNVLVTHTPFFLNENLDIHDSLWITPPPGGMFTITDGNLEVHAGAFAEVINTTLEISNGNWKNQGGVFEMTSSNLDILNGNWTNQNDGDFVAVFDLNFGSINLYIGNFKNDGGTAYFTDAHVTLHPGAGNFQNVDGMVDMSLSCIEILSEGNFKNDNGLMLGSGAVSADPGANVTHTGPMSNWDVDIMWCGDDEGNTPPMDCHSCTGPTSAEAICAGIVLGVDFARFEVYAYGGQILVRWEVHNETDIRHYLVERSSTGKIWNDVALLPAYGFEVMTYEYTDIRPMYDVSYYRITAVTYDGEHIWSPIQMVMYFEPDAGELTVYPNPMREGQFYVDLANTPQSEGIIEVVDISGKRIYAQKVIPGLHGRIFSINANWPSGTYMVRYLAGPVKKQAHLVIAQVL